MGLSTRQAGCAVRQVWPLCLSIKSALMTIDGNRCQYSDKTTGYDPSNPNDILIKSIGCTGKRLFTHSACTFLTFKHLFNQAVICTMIGVQVFMNKFLRILIFKFRSFINFIFHRKCNCSANARLHYALEATLDSSKSQWTEDIKWPTLKTGDNSELWHSIQWWLCFSHLAFALS